MSSLSIWRGARVPAVSWTGEGGGLPEVSGWGLSASLRLRGWATEQLQPKNGKSVLL